MRAGSRIPSLDGLRAISILLVLGAHLLGALGLRGSLGSAEKWVDNLAALGVRIFFVISGFLITGLLLKELEESGRINLRRFYLRRTLRIFPAYYFFLCWMILLRIAGQVKLSGNDALHALTYTVNYYPERSWDIGHAWSLAVEEQFYLAWPALLLLLRWRGGLVLALGLLLLCPLIRLGYFVFMPELIRYEAGYRFETVADSIACGCLLAGGFNWLNTAATGQRILRSKSLLLAPLLALAVSLLDARGLNSLLVGVTVQNLAIAACVAWCVANGKGRIGRVLNSRPLVALGLLSYSLYLWQQPFLNPDPQQALLGTPLNLIMVVAAALFSYFAVETTALRLRGPLEARLFGGRHETGPGNTIPEGQQG